ncbi:MAG: hypothetical protein KDD94_12705 [Calditrichaeota bacterium]|nr:hypothetical protein [Calditrichota bacterium]
MKRYHQNYLSDNGINRRYFLGFGKKDKNQPVIREGAIEPEKLKELIEKIGISKKIIIKRIDYDGNELEKSTVIITSTHMDHFTGKVVNLDRDLQEESSGNKIFIKGGGGTVDFYYADGDISSIEEDIDNELIHTKDKNEILEVVEALEVNDEILISFYRKGSGGVINGNGVLSEKDMAEKTFSVQLSTLNGIEQNPTKEFTFKIMEDPIIDLQIQ